jgi:hypothetical protein
MGSFWSSDGDAGDCAACLAFVENMIRDQESNIEKIDFDIEDLEGEYLEYEDEHSKQVTLRLVASYRESRKLMFEHLAELKQSRLRITLIKTKFHDVESIQQEFTILEKLKTKIASTEHKQLFNSVVNDMHSNIQLPVLPQISTENVIDIRAAMMNRNAKVKKQTKYVILEE